MSDGSLDDEELVRRFRAGAPHALDLLIERYIVRAMGVAREYASDLDEAEDLVQEGFQRAVRALPRFDDRQRFAPWFFTILRNVGRNAARDARNRQPLEDAAHVASTAESSADTSERELRRHVERELAAMPQSQAGCFRLCDIEGFTAQEVGDMMGLAPPTVRTHAHRARIKLRDALTRLGYEAPRMSEWRGFSRLPQSPEYWRDLSARVQQSAHSVPVSREVTARSLAPLAWTAIAAALIAVIASRALPLPADQANSVRQAISPADSLASSWLAMPEPPSTAEVLIGTIRGKS